MYPVSDIDRSRKFYEDTLGLVPGSTTEYSPGMWWIEYDIGTTALGITNFAAPDCRKGPAVALEVADYDSALETIKSAGIEITWGPNDLPPCRCFGIKDPDGNELFIHKRKTALD